MSCRCQTVDDELSITSCRHRHSISAFPIFGQTLLRVLSYNISSPNIIHPSISASIIIYHNISPAIIIYHISLFTTNIAYPGISYHIVIDIVIEIVNDDDDIYSSTSWYSLAYPSTSLHILAYPSTSKHFPVYPNITWWYILAYPSTS